MDPRGYSVDPNANAVEDVVWWQSVGPAQSPSAYATASWEYTQDYEIITETITVDPELIEQYDNGAIFGKAFWVLVLDGGGSFDDLLDLIATIDDGEFNQENGIITVERTYTLARVSVYDTKASFPGPYRLIDMNRGDLQTDPDADDINTEGAPIDGFTIDIYDTANPGDEKPPGTMLGYLDFQILDGVAAILNWGHPNWHDSLPIQKAFLAMKNSLPSCVEQILVEDTPSAFWTSLGFRPLGKGDSVLYYDVK